MKYADRFGKYDTELLMAAKEKLFNVYSANYIPSSRKTRLLETIIDKLENLINEFGEKK